MLPIYCFANVIQQARALQLAVCFEAFSERMYSGLHPVEREHIAQAASL